MSPARNRSERAKAPVAAARCTSYEPKAVRRAVERCLEALPELRRRFREADRVLLKPNLLSSTAGPDAHVNTHPAVLRALAEAVGSEFDCEVWIGDSCGSFTRGSTARALERSGVLAVAEEVGARTYNVDRQPRGVIRPENSRIYGEIPLPTNLDEFDLIVSTAKLKTHMLTCVTGPVKNMLGLVPGGAKKQAHLLAPRPVDFATLLCDLYAALPPAVAFADGIVGMEGAGPNSGDLREVGLVAAGTDPVAVDSFCAQVMGFDPMAVPLLAECEERGLGRASPRAVVPRDGPPAAYAPKDFVRPVTYANSFLARLIPRRALRGLLSTFTARRARIDAERCRVCGECARNCPSRAISLHPSGDRYRVDPTRCISCYCCAEVCPFDAVEVEPTAAARLADRLRSRR